MSENNNGWGRSTVVVGTEGQPAAPHQPAFDRSIGTSRRGTVYVGVTEEQRGPGLPSQEQAGGRVPNVVQQMDQGGKTVGVHVVTRSTITEPDGRTPFKGGEVTSRHIIDVEGVGQMRVRDALSLGLIKPADLNMPDSAAPTKSLVMQQAEARQKAEAAPEAPEVSAVDRALAADYAEVATGLDKAMTSVGLNSDTILDQLATGDPTAISPDMVQRVAQHMGADNFTQAVEAMTLHVYAAADKALPQGANLDAVMDIVESPAHSRRWSQAYTSYLRSGDSTLIAGLVREVARGLR